MWAFKIGKHERHILVEHRFTLTKYTIAIIVSYRNIIQIKCNKKLYSKELPAIWSKNRNLGRGLLKLNVFAYYFWGRNLYDLVNTFNAISKVYTHQIVLLRLIKKCTGNDQVHMKLRNLAKIRSRKLTPTKANKVDLCESFQLPKFVPSKVPWRWKSFNR